MFGGEFGSCFFAASCAPEGPVSIPIDSESVVIARKI
jgi:hypothetical protein